MDSPAPTEFMATLQLAGQGEKQAAAALLPLVYEQLRQVAAVRLEGFRSGQTLQPTALVHEAYLRLVGEGDPGWNGKRHFFGAAARAMRNILVERARHKAAIKHGGGLQRVSLEAAERAGALAVDDIDIIELDTALIAFEAIAPEATQVVMLRYFAGLTEAETAKLLSCSPSTVRRHWVYAKAWLHRKLAEHAP